MKKIIACLIVASAGMSFGCGGGGGGGTSAPPVGATITSVTPNTVTPRIQPRSIFTSTDRSTSPLVIGGSN
jgi:hypothetical protein